MMMNPDSMMYVLIEMVRSWSECTFFILGSLYLIRRLGRRKK